MVSHISQIDFFEKRNDIRIYSSENVYVFNDAAAKFINDQGIKNFIYPFENAYTNLMRGKNRNGIVPLYFLPPLFTSRMPVNEIDKDFSDEKNEYAKVVINGITAVIPKFYIALFQFKRKLKGFNNFLIDLSYISPSKGLLKKILEKYDKGEAYQPSKTFNFKKGLG